MEEETIVDIDTTTDEVEEVEAEETVESLKEKNQALYEQLQKSKGKTRDEDGKWVKKETKPAIKVESPSKSNELDYGQKAFLVASGIKGEAETKLVRDAMRESGKSLEQVLESKYFQSELESHRELANTTKASDGLKGRRSNTQTDSVEYWMSKPIAEVPPEMRIKVVNARIAKEKGGGVFYNS